jgi:hypothetical protein
MSHSLINRSEDLKRLRDEGYEIAVDGAYLAIPHVPYLDSKRMICYGTLVSTLHLAGDRTARPDTHVVTFAGSFPCHADGSPIVQIAASSQPQQLTTALTIDHTFSSKPAAGYSDYYEKMATYIRIVGTPVRSVDPSVTARTYAVIETSAEESVFRYLDTATSRAGIGVAASKLELTRVAIVGLGGTGSYVLDLVAKTPVREIHIFDDDTFYSHNAFRSPGAPSLDELRSAPSKVSHFRGIYDRIHRGIVAHECNITADNVDQLGEMAFVFLCFNGGPAKRAVVERLQALDIPFVDVGMGLHEVDGSIGGTLRITTSSSERHDHVWARSRIPFAAVDVDDVYARNIQVADLNALNATLAVIRLKKLFGFYLDFDHEHWSSYAIDGNHLLNEELPCRAQAA